MLIISVLRYSGHIFGTAKLEKILEMQMFFTKKMHVLDTES